MEVIKKKMKHYILIATFILWLYIAIKKHKSISAGLRAAKRIKKSRDTFYTRHNYVLVTEYNARLLAFWVLILFPFGMMLAYSYMSQADFIGTCISMIIYTCIVCRAVHASADTDLKRF